MTGVQTCALPISALAAHTKPIEMKKEEARQLLSYWHVRLGHCSIPRMPQMALENLVEGMPTKQIITIRKNSHWIELLHVSLQGKLRELRVRCAEPSNPGLPGSGLWGSVKLGKLKES